MTLGNLHQLVLESNSRPIVHMRKQVELNRFGLLFGAGLSQPCKIPNWHSLVSALASDNEVAGEEVLRVTPPRAGLPYQTEMLFEHYRRRRYGHAETIRHYTRELDYQIGADWRNLIRKHLYASVDGNISKSLDSHPYLKTYLPLVRRTHMTVTYNFDDFLEQSLLHDRGGAGLSTLGFESVTNPWTQFRHQTAVIYHPNGVIPQNPLETPNDRFVFSEASYVKQLMGIFSGDQAGLISHLSKHTCLLIGLSLEDDTLRNVLMQAAHACPGNFHYYVHYIEPGALVDDETKHAIRLANFKVYNLVTLFLNKEEIKALGDLINIEQCPTNTFCDFAEQHDIRVKYRFYITGAMGVGKSTVINQFRNLYVLDEWMEERLEVLAKPWDDLTLAEREQADSWIVNQFKLKNDLLRNNREGIFVMDRGPLDPVTFTPEDEWCSKAERLLDAICPGQAQWSVEDGRVVLLRGECGELALRMIMTQRKAYTADKLKELEEKLRTVYGSNGVTEFDTNGLSPTDVTRRLAEVIHLDNYESTCNLHERLNGIKRDGTNVTS